MVYLNYGAYKFTIFYMIRQNNIITGNLMQVPVQIDILKVSPQLSSTSIGFFELGLTSLDEVANQDSL